MDSSIAVVGGVVGLPRKTKKLRLLFEKTLLVKAQWTNDYFTTNIGFENEDYYGPIKMSFINLHKLH